MRRHRNAVLLAAGTLALSIGFATTSSAAATATWTVKRGGNFSGSGSMTLKDTKTDAPLRCPSVTLAGKLKTGSGLSGAGIGSITSVSFSKRCAIVHPTMTAAAHGLPWKLNVLTYNSGRGVTNGSLSGVDVRATGNIAGPCDFTVDGSAVGANDGRVKFTYANSTGKLKLLVTGGTLHVYKASCFGIFANGDPITPSGSFTLNPKQEITSP